MNAHTAKRAIAHGSIQTPSLREQLMRSAGIASESGDTPLVGTGGMVGGLAHTVEKLLRAHELMTRLHGERWPAMSAPWKRIIAAKATKENISDMAAAVALAKEAPMPAQSLLILAAAVEMKTPNAADVGRAGNGASPAAEPHSNT